MWVADKGVGTRLFGVCEGGGEVTEEKKRERGRRSEISKQNIRGEIWDN